MKRVWIIRAAIGALMLGGFASLPATLPTPETNVPATLNQKNTGPIDSNALAVQQFLADGRDIRTVSVLLATYLRTNHGGVSLTVASLNGNQWTTLGTLVADKATLQDNAFQTYRFVPPLPVAPHQPVRITLAADGDPNNAITWQTSADVRPVGYSLHVNGKEQPGSARFHVEYAGKSGRVGQLIRPMWQRLTIFLDPLWQVVLIVGMAIIAGGVILSGRSLVD